MGRVKRRGWRDPNGQHVRIYQAVMKSPSWLALSSSGIRLYLDMRQKLTSFNNGNIEAVFGELKHRGWKSKTTLHRSLRELETLGLIAQTRQGGIASMSRICSLYRFTEVESYDFQKQGVTRSRATHDYRRFASVREAKAAVREAVAQRQQLQQNKSKVQELDLTGPIFDPILLRVESNTVQSLPHAVTETGPIERAPEAV